MRNFLKLIGERFYLTKQSRRVRPWFEIDGDNTLRMEYRLDENSVVFDLGGFKGQWASDIFSRYQCNVFVFEPVLNFYEAIEKRFHHNGKIKVFPFGLAKQTAKTAIGVSADSSSMFNKTGRKTQTAELHSFGEFLRDHKIETIDLMKINIEGAEYDLLDSIIEEGRQNSIANIQVQFHDFVPDAENRMKSIQKALTQTHEMTWHYPFVWENWRIRKDA